MAPMREARGSKRRREVRHSPRRRVATWLPTVLVAGAVAVAGLDLTGHLEGGLVDDPAPTPTAAAPLDPAREPAGDVLAPEPTASGQPAGAETFAQLLTTPALGAACALVR